MLKKKCVKWRLKIEPAGEDCEECGSPMAFYKMGRMENLLACSNFPDCRNTKPICKSRLCKVSEMLKKENIVERKSKEKAFILLGSVISPGLCSFISWDTQIARKCPKCENLLVEERNEKGTQVKSAQVAIHKEELSSKREWDQFPHFKFKNSRFYKMR